MAQVFASEVLWAKKRNSLFNSILREDCSKYRSLDAPIERLLQAKEYLKSAILNTGVERIECIRTARSEATAFLNQSPSNESLYCQLVLAFSYLLTPDQIAEADPYLQRILLLTKESYPEIWSFASILRGYILVNSDYLDRSEINLQDYDFSEQNILSQLQMIHIALSFDNKALATKLIHHLSSAHPIAVTFLIADDRTRLLLKEIVESFSKIRSIGRAEISESFSKWNSYLQRLDSAEKHCDFQIIQDKDRFNIGDFDRSSLGQIPVLDLEPTNFFIMNQFEVLRKAAVDNLRKEQWKRKEAFEGFKKEYQDAETERDLMILEASLRRSQTMNGLNQEIQISDQEGTRAEKGCLGALAIAAIVIVGYIAVAIVLSTKGHGVNWDSDTSKLCFFVAGIPICVAGAYQVVFILKRLLLNAQIRIHTDQSNIAFQQARDFATEKFSATLKEVEIKRLEAEQQVQRVSESMALIASETHFQGQANLRRSA